jgi:plasmid maintenance system antidote protein VapI
VSALEYCTAHRVYTAGCRDCQARAREYRLERRRDRRKFGPPRLDVGPVRAHLVALLESGQSATALAAVAGVSQATISRIAAGLNQTVSREVAGALLGVTLDRVRQADHYVPATLATRRLQHMAYMGWTVIRLASLLPISNRVAGVIIHGDQERITREVDDAIGEFFRAHWMEDGGSKRARTAARTYGWVSIAAYLEPSNPLSRPTQAVVAA